jgi:hypothetical protein
VFKLFTYFACLFAVWAPLNVSAQQETADTTNIKKPIEENVVTETPKVKYAHSPKKAAYLSAILPGLGQAYNKKWWKIPIVWAAIGTSTGFIVYNQHKYKIFKHAYINYINGVTDEYTGYGSANLFDIQDTYHNWRDISIIVTAGFYVLNILDAVVDAHFFRFDISEDLSLEFTPNLNFVKPGFSVCLKF